MAKRGVSGLRLAVRVVGLLVVAVAVIVSTLAAAGTVTASSASDVAVTGRTYVRQDGGSDLAIATCNRNDVGVTNASKRQAN